MYLARPLNKKAVDEWRKHDITVGPDDAAEQATAKGAARVHSYGVK